MSETKQAVEFPVFLRHAGIWEGTYTLMDAKTGEVLDHHKSRLTCKTNGIDEYSQQNVYTWDDGKVETKEFPGGFSDGALRFDNPRLKGIAFEADADTIILTWSYKDGSNDKYAEIITLESDTHRCRTWQHFENGVFAKLTVIDEQKVA
jgi:Domain of unknown function (DUF3598)